MNTTPKVILNINLLGILSKKTNEEQIHWEKSTQDNPNIIIARGTCLHNYRIPTIAVQKIKICEDAYQYFISSEIPGNYKPRDYKGKNWKSLTIDERLRFNLSEIANNHTFTYEVLN